MLKIAYRCPFALWKVPIKLVYMFLRRFNMDPSRNEFAHLNVGRVYINHFQQYVVFLLFPLCIQTVPKLFSFHSKSSIYVPLYQKLKNIEIRVLCFLFIMIYKSLEKSTKICWI